MRFGFHISIAEGLENVVTQAKELGCEAVQIFTGSNKRWSRPALDHDTVRRFCLSVKKARLSPLIVHLFYLPNLASPDPELLIRSRQALFSEIERSNLLGADFLVFHPGAFKESSLEQGIARVIHSLNLALSTKEETKLKLLIENTSGGGTKIGSRFEELTEIIEGVEKKDSVGVCLDIAHAFQAGYPLHTENGFTKTLSKFDKLLGLTRLHLVHLNDSKTPLGSRNDRHYHIGEGEIGLEAFRRIINHPMLSHLPAIMETPTSLEDDLRNMATVKHLRDKYD
ncbi:deoxyribonuclease IV [candidate division WOR-3 bacterium]|nr:deoxyribonuclease IV [candidate division WOR-3 bacterium]